MSGKQPVFAVNCAPRGPRFFRGADGEVMFEIQLDRRSKVGPRPAIDEDRRQYPHAWSTFEADVHDEPPEPVKPLLETVDHPGAKAAHDEEKADRQRRMDQKRGSGL